MRISMLAIPVLLLVSLSPAAMKASDITYNVNAPVGAAGSLTGFITTDGDAGVLTSADIVSWNLLLTVPPLTNSQVDAGTPATERDISEGSLLTATPTALSFDFSGSGYFALEEYANVCCISLELDGTGYGNNMLLFDCSTAACTDLYAVSQPETGSVVIGTSANETIAATPEPTTICLTLTGVGLLGLLVVTRRRYSSGFPQATYTHRDYPSLA